MTFYELLTAAVRDIADHGYDSQKRVDDWMAKIRASARIHLVREGALQEALRRTFRSVYDRMVERGLVLELNPGVGRFTVDRLKPKLRRELDRRIMASADLITLNREQSISQTLQRFQGWATSIPAGGSRVVDKVDTKDGIRRALARLPFEERRVMIDQGHKLSAAINDIVAKDSGALAMVWHSTFQAGYDFRRDHRSRDGRVYAIRGAWAFEKGLAKVGPAGWSDEITQPAEEPFCRCHASYIHSIGSLPADMLTEKGRDELARIRAEMAA